MGDFDVELDEDGPIGGDIDEEDFELDLDAEDEGEEGAEDGS